MFASGVGAGGPPAANRPGGAERLPWNSEAVSSACGEEACAADEVGGREEGPGHEVTLSPATPATPARSELTPSLSRERSPQEGADRNPARWEGRAKVTGEMGRWLFGVCRVEGSGFSLGRGGVGGLPFPALCAWPSLTFAKGTSLTFAKWTSLTFAKGQIPDTQALPGSLGPRGCWRPSPTPHHADCGLWAPKEELLFPHPVQPDSQTLFSILCSIWSWPPPPSPAGPLHYPPAVLHPPRGLSHLLRHHTFLPKAASCS